MNAIQASCSDLAGVLGIELEFRQPNYEGDLIDIIQRERKNSDALVINPAGLSFHSRLLLDAFWLFPGPIIELNLSNTHDRDEQHCRSIMSGAVTAVVCGLGPYGYVMALLSAARLVTDLPDSLPAALQIGPV